MIPADRIARNLANSRSTKEALLKSGFAPLTAATQAKAVVDRPDVQALLKKYLPVEKAFKATNDALAATKWNDDIQEHEVDHTTRLKATDQVYKLNKLYDDAGAAGRDTNIVFNINLDEPHDQRFGPTIEADLVEPAEIQDPQLAPESPQD